MAQNHEPSTRRRFLNHASAAAAALSSIAAASAKSQKTIRPGVSARSASRVVGANDRINVGMIGVGGMGRCICGPSCCRPMTRKTSGSWR
jgi:hypothetical protein